MIHGIDVILYEKTKTGANSLGEEMYTLTPVTVSNVLVAPLSDEEILSELNLTGKRATYQLGIPKGDTHDWENSIVFFFGESWRTIGKPTQGIEAMIPLSWNKKVKVESIVWKDPNST